MIELEILQAELNAINKQIQLIINPRIAAEKASMTEEQKIQNTKAAIDTANQVLTSLQNNLTIISV
jgi:hypothetical protein